MAQAMAGFLQWLAADYGGHRRCMLQDIARRRQKYTESASHRRTATILANLETAWELFLRFATESKALSRDEADVLRQRGAAALEAAAAAQVQHLAANDPVERFVELLSAAVASGRAHLANADGGVPSEPQAWGWRWDSGSDGWRPQGHRIGWLDAGNVYLEPEAALAVVQQLGDDTGDGIAIASATLRKRLHERGLLASIDQKRDRLVVRRRLERKRRAVLHVKAAVLHAPKPAQPAQCE